MTHYTSNDWQILYYDVLQENGAMSARVHELENENKNLKEKIVSLKEENQLLYEDYAYQQDLLQEYIFGLILFHLGN